MSSGASALPSRGSSSSSSSSSAKELFWFNVSGMIGTALFMGCYQLVLMALPFDLYRATAAWVISYLLSIVWQHALHRHLVFGTGGDYWASLLRTYIAYTLSIALSSAFTFVLDLAGVHPQLAFALATGATGLFNYLTLRDVFKAPAKPNVS